MAEISRQLLTTLIRSFARGAITKNDQKYGRQLATICEQTSLILRAHLGGKPTWELGQSAKKVAPKSSNGGVEEPTTITVLDAEQQWELELAFWREIAVLESPLGVITDYEMGLRIQAAGFTADHFVWPILDARREKRTLTIKAPDGGEIEIADYRAEDLFPRS